MKFVFLKIYYNILYLLNEGLGGYLSNIVRNTFINFMICAFKKEIKK